MKGSWKIDPKILIPLKKVTHAQLKEKWKFSKFGIIFT